MLEARDATRLHPPKTRSPPQSPIALEQLNPRVRRIWGLVICGAFREELRAEAPDSRMQVTNFASMITIRFVLSPEVRRCFAS